MKKMLIKNYKKLGEKVPVDLVRDNSEDIDNDYSRFKFGNVKEGGQALIAVIMLMLIIFIMAFGLLTSTINLSTTNQGDVYLHGSQSASQAGLGYFAQLMNEYNFINCTNSPSASSSLPVCVHSNQQITGNLGSGNGPFEHFASHLEFPNCIYVNSSGQDVACTSTADCEMAATQNNTTCSYDVVSVGCMVASQGSKTCINGIKSTATQTYEISGNSFLNYAFYNNYSADDPGDAASYGTYNSTSGTYSESAAQENFAKQNCAFYMWAKKGINGNKSLNSTGYGPNYGTYNGPNGNTRACAFTYEDYGNVFTGSVYSTDIMWDCGATYNGQVTTGDPIKGGYTLNQNMNWLGFYGNNGNFNYDNQVGSPFNIGSPYYDTYPVGCNNTSPTYNINGNPCTSNCVKQVAALSPPPALTQLQSEAEVGGCEFFGPTVVDLMPGGKMAVYSPDTTMALADSAVGLGFGVYGHSYVSGGNTVWPCGTPADATTGVSLGGQCNTVNGTGGLGAPLPASGIPQCIINVPDPKTNNGNGVTATGGVYVANVPSTPYSTYCPLVEGEINSPGESSVGCQYTMQQVQKCGYYGCHYVTKKVPNGEQQGDLLIQSGNGQSNSSNTGFDAFATFGSASNIIITGSLIYANSAQQALGNNNFAYWDSSNPALSDSLGLAATKFVEVNLGVDQGYFGYNTGNGAGGAHQNYILDAAILCAQHSFGVANLSSTGGNGPLEGNIVVNGSIATNFTLNNCLVGTSGYCNYQTTYDQSFANVNNQPPQFPTPVIIPTQYLEG